MICIAESGSTKTDWVIVDGEQMHEFNTIGFNPFFVNEGQVMQGIIDAIPENIRSSISHVYFYGAGCSDPGRNEVIASGIRSSITKANIEVEHDLLAAARAVCLHQKGIACILGTGSNSCYFDGKQITDNVTALGYILGDEGGGVALGKALIKSYIYRELPRELSEELSLEYEVEKEQILNAVYKQPLPNRYLASFAPFYSKHRNHPYIQVLLAENFNEFIVRHVLKYERQSGHKVGFVGSIACTFESELKQQLSRFDVEPGEFLRKPIDRLVKFHTLGD